jgi:hypothetical protein
VAGHHPIKPKAKSLNSSPVWFYRPSKTGRRSILRMIANAKWPGPLPDQERNTCFSGVRRPEACSSGNLLHGKTVTQLLEVADLDECRP